MSGHQSSIYHRFYYMICHIFICHVHCNQQDITYLAMAYTYTVLGRAIEAPPPLTDTHLQGTPTSPHGLATASELGRSLLSLFLRRESFKPVACRVQTSAVLQGKVAKAPQRTEPPGGVADPGTESLGSLGASCYARLGRSFDDQGRMGLGDQTEEVCKVCSSLHVSESSFLFLAFFLASPPPRFRVHASL